MGSDRKRGWLQLVLLESATLVSGAGNGAAVVVLPWLVLERTGSASSAGLLAAVTALPLLLSSLFSGTVVDTLGRKRAAVGADVFSCVSVAAIPLVDRAFGLNLGWLMVLAVIGAMFDPAGVTARETMLPEAAAAAGWPLERANGVHEAVWNVSFIIGPGVGGVLIAWVGAIDALWITAVGFAVTAVLTAVIRLPGTAAPHPDDAGDGMWADTAAGLRFVWHDRLLLAVTAMSAALISIYMPIEGVLLPVHFEALDQPGRLGGIVMAMSIGGIVGALAYSAWGVRFRRSLVFRLALLATAVFIVVLALLPSFPVMIVASFAIGLAYGPVGPVVNLAMQSRSPDHMRGRVVGIITSTEYAAGPVGYLLVGAATERWGVGPTFVTVAVVLVGVAGAGLFVRGLGELDGLEPPDGSDGARPRSAVIDEATRGPVPLVRPPRDPEQLIR